VSEQTAFISFLSDYGRRDEFVGVCHGVMARRCPRAHVIDITHEIPRHDLTVGALTLRDSVRFLPAGIHLAIVDPGVGASGAEQRRAVALRCRHEDRWLVGPDNGLLAPAAQALGGVAQALDIAASRERLTPVSATFHGRDVFAPVAAALADGAIPESVGEPLDPGALRNLTLPQAELSGDTLHAHVLSIDRFGNVALDATPAQLHQLGLAVSPQASIEAPPRRSSAIYAVTFADVAAGAMLIYEDSRGMAALAVNEGSAAHEMDLRRGDEVIVRLA
jgi:S-adenosyl-L-methionine hydrolase (adenosine-forming)